MTTFDILKEFNSGTKIKIICHLSQHQELCISDLVRLTGFKRENVSKQVCELKESGLLLRREDGRNNYYRLDDSLPIEVTNLITSIIKLYDALDDNH